MEFLKKIFAPITATLSFIGKHFKALIFLLILYVLFFSNGANINANLVEIKLQGEIIDPSAVLNKIYKASDDDNIRGVLINIDSPGGAFSPSIELEEAIKLLSKKKTTIVYASGTMASGSYLSGVWANKIYANKGSFIGSIGVIMQGLDISNLAGKIGIKEQVVKVGEFKEAGTIMREWNQKERESLQQLAGKSYELFINEVATARKLDINATDKWANAKVFLAQEAKELGLIDGISNYKDVKKIVETQSGVTVPLWQENPPFEKFFANLENSSKMAIKSLFQTKILAK